MNFTPLAIISLILIKFCTSEEFFGVKEIVNRHGDVEIALILHQCENHTNSQQFLKQSLINSALWTVERANFLNLSSTENYGLKVYETCSEFDDINTIFEIFKRKESSLIGLISDCRFTSTIKKFSEVLNIKTTSISIFYRPLVKAAVELIDSLKWGQEVVVAAPDGEIVEEFFKIADEKNICIQDFHVYKTILDIPQNSTENTSLVLFGYPLQIEKFLGKKRNNQENLILIPLDGSIITNDLPKKSYVVVAPQSRLNPEKKAIFSPSPTLFQVANPILAYIQADNRNETYLTELDPFEIINLLKIEPLAPNFHYNIYKGDNGSQPFSKIATYSIFNETLNLLDPNLNDFENNSEFNYETCKNFDKIASYSINRGEIRIRNESWVFAFLSISFLGLLFCLAILIFLVICIYRRDILEGNPSMTLLLLLTIMLMYVSVLPLCLEGKNDSLCLIRSLSITSSYCASFSLILSRGILLATASKEIGFMSHVAGPVQSFLGLFIFGVQCALNLQIIGHCSEVYNNFSFVYLLSYNAMLLMLLMCLGPLIYKCDRNYREGKYFTVAACLMTCVWGLWVPTFAILDHSWKDPILCFGLVSTASILLGAIFIPRTYLMTLAAARDKIASTLPSLATASSAMDIYRTGAQPVYDCVNVAAVSAMSIARAGLNPNFNNHQQPDLYLDEDYEARCDSPLNSDKITRF